MFFVLLQGHPEVLKNSYVADSLEYRLPLVLAEATKPLECFNCVAYYEKNPDLPRSWDCRTFFEHYVNYGQFEGRPFEYVSPPPAQFAWPGTRGPLQRTSYCPF
jgi:hypothetical protein